MSTQKTVFEPNFLPCKTEQELIERYGAISLEKQLDFRNIVSNNGWNIDLLQGKISFGNKLVFDIQVLGTFSYISQTWLWSWANIEQGFSEDIIQQALSLKLYGENNSIPLLSNEAFDFSKEELHIIGFIASGIFNAFGYYIAEYGQGAMLITIKNNLENTTTQPQTEKYQNVLSIFPQFIAQFESNHKNAFKSYLILKNYEISETEHIIIATKDNYKITGEFDELSRLISLNG